MGDGKKERLRLEFDPQNWNFMELNSKIIKH